ncbi:MAG: hypothetical protein IPO83_17170 [Chitinophagaceae bacterium]|nr:hypothetical protein [Chitinophagaceae bacterium]
MKAKINFFILASLMSLGCIITSCSKNTDMLPLQTQNALLDDTSAEILQSSQPYVEHYELKKNHPDVKKQIQPFEIPAGYSLEKKGKKPRLIRMDPVEFVGPPLTK